MKKFSYILTLCFAMLLMVDVSFAQTSSKSRNTTRNTSISKQNQSQNQNYRNTTRTTNSRTTQRDTTRNTRNTRRNRDSDGDRDSRSGMSDRDGDERNANQNSAQNTTPANQPAANSANANTPASPNAAAQANQSNNVSAYQNQTNDPNANRNAQTIFSSFRSKLGEPDLEPTADSLPASSALNAASDVAEATGVPTLTSTEYLYHTGIDSFVHRDYAAAQDNFDQLIELASYSVYGHFAQGMALFLRDDYTKSLEAFNKSYALSERKNLPVPKIRQLRVAQSDFNFHFLRLAKYKNEHGSDANAASLLEILTKVGNYSLDQ